VTYQNQWFDGRNSRRQLPLECICDCSGAGDRDDDVGRWVDRLEFDGPAWFFRDYLKGFGCWDAADLCDHDENKKRVLWIWACNAREDPEAYGFLYLGA
jgi:hypothetical protein